MRSKKIKCVIRLNFVKTSSVFFFIVLILLLCSPIAFGGLAPDFTLTDIDGNAFSLSDFRGKVAIIEFFATWCGYCITEIPHLKAVHDEFGGGELVIISISQSDTNTQLINFRNTYQIPWIVAKDTANVFQLYNVQGLPNLYLIDHEGVIAYHDSGVVEASTIIAKVNEILTARADLNGDGTVNITDVVTAALAFGSKPGDPDWNPIADLNQDGKIAITDIVIIALHFGEHV